MGVRVCTKILPRVIITYGACARGGGRRPGFEATIVTRARVRAWVEGLGARAGRCPRAHARVCKVCARAAQRMVGALPIIKKLVEQVEKSFL